MNYRSRTDSYYPITLSQIRARANYLFGDEPTRDVLDDLGIDAVEDVSRPEDQEGMSITEGDPVEYEPGKWRQNWVVSELPPPDPILPGPPVLRASALGLKVIEGDFDGIPNAFNIGGAIYFDVGQYLMFFVNPIPEPYVPLFITDGQYSVTSSSNDEYSMTIEVQSDGTPADPSNLSVQVYQR